MFPTNTANTLSLPNTADAGGRGLQMQAADGGPEAGADADDGGEQDVLVPTVFPPRRPKTYKLKKGQVGGRGG